MKTTIQMTDDVYDAYTSAAEGMAGLGKPLTPEEIMVDRLTRFKGVSPSDRVVVVEPPIRGRLEMILGGGSLKDSEDLLKKVEALADIQIGGIRIEFSPGELKQMAHWSRRQGKTVEFILGDIVSRIKLGIFDRVG